VGTRRRPWPLVALLALLAGAVALVAVGLSPGTEGDEPFAGPDDAHESRDVAVLTGRGEEPQGARLEEDSPPEAPAPVPAAAERGAPRPHRVRVLDARGAPIEAADVVLALAPGGAVLARTGADGWATLAVPEGSRILGVTASARGPLGSREILRLEDADGLDPAAIETLTAGGAVRVVLRTVDTRGNARSGQRIAYRAHGDEGNWYGTTSDSQGLVVLGVLPLGTRLDVRPAPRGRSPAEEAAIPWREIAADGLVADVVVGDAPAIRLRVRIGGLSKEARTPIAVLDAATGHEIFRAVHWGNGVWSAMEPVDDRPVEVVVGPTEDGRFARVRDHVPAPEVLDVEPGAVPVLSGWVVSPEAAAEGSVTATGRGFTASAAVDERGAFRFPGVPEEEVVLAAEVRVGAEALRGRLDHRHRAGAAVTVVVGRGPARADKPSAPIASRP
jgi:hypothetical protein